MRISLGNLAQALLLTVLTVAASPLLEIVGVTPIISYSIIFTLLIAIILLTPIVSARLDAKFGEQQDLRNGLYVELYIRDGKPHISLFRASFNWRRARSDIYGAVFEIQKTDTGLGLVQTKPSGWQSHFLNIAKDRDGGKLLQYFYKSSDDDEITGVTRMEVSRHISFGEGFFLDIRHRFSSSKVVPFQYARLSMNKGNLADNNRKVYNTLKRKMRAGFRSRWGIDLKNKIAPKLELYFRDKIAPEFAKLVVEKSPELRLITQSDIESQLVKALDDITRLLTEEQSSSDTEDLRILAEIEEKLSKASAHAKYSSVKVGAAIVGENGSERIGINLENAAYPLGTCAEQAAIAAFVCDTGGDERIAKVVLTAEGIEDIRPCGGCLQRILEYAGADCQVVIGKRGVLLSRYRLNELLPHAFQFAGPR